MTSTDQSWATEFLTKQVELLNAKDTAGLANRYAPDATFVRFDGIRHGRDEIKKLFDDYILENPEIISLDGAMISEDVILYKAAERLSGKLLWAIGTLVFVDGLVWRQTATFIETLPTE